MHDTSLQVNLQQNSPIRLNIGFQCNAGELLALVGPSGSGKSTVLRIIAGLEHISSGRINCNGRVWLDTNAATDLRPQQRSAGLVFQHFALFPHRTAIENIMLAMHHQPAKVRRKLALSLLDKTNMIGFENRKPHSLSGGQRQRVALARALAREPDVLLLDEPFSAVDQQTRRKLYRELAQLRRTLDIPMLLVTHDIHEVQQLADSVCLIYRGESLQQGKVQDVITQPHTKEIAKLLGHQNLFAGNIESHARPLTHYRIGDHNTLAGPRFDMPTGTAVTLLISPSAIRLNPPAGYRHGDTGHADENTLRGHVADVVALGDELSIRLKLDRVSKALRFQVPGHVAKEYRICAGSELTVSVLATGIYAMIRE